jgi:hypothetical protein
VIGRSVDPIVYAELQDPPLRGLVELLIVFTVSDFHKLDRDTVKKIAFFPVLEIVEVVHEVVAP